MVDLRVLDYYCFRLVDARRTAQEGERLGIASLTKWMYGSISKGTAYDVGRKVMLVDYLCTD